MADISAIKLPNNTTLNLKDASALKQLDFANHSLVALTRAGTSTTIDLGEFDTLSVTDLNVGNLVTTGSGRFTNGLYGNLTGNVTGNVTGSVTGNASTASAFSSSRTITLSGDTTGSGSGNGSSGWSIATTTKKMTPTTLSTQNLNDYHNTITTEFYYAGGSNNVSNNPANSSTTPATNTGAQFGMISYASASGHVTQELASNGVKWIRFYNSSSWSAWNKFLTSGNYTDYTVTKTGTGASGTWDISISGNAATATTATALGTNAGSATQPIYFSSGKPAATTYALQAGVIYNTHNATTGAWSTIQGRTSNPVVSVMRHQATAPTWAAGAYSSSLVWGGGDTKGLINCSYSGPVVVFGGASTGNSTDDAPYWWFKLSGTSGQTYTLPTASKTLAASDGSNASGTWGISISGNAATATSATSATSATNATNATTATKLSYQSQLTTQADIDGFIDGNRFMVATFKTTDANNIDMASNDGMIISVPWVNTSYGAQIALDDSTVGVMKFRGRSNNTWGNWRTVIHDGNYTSYTVTKTGSGASGSWGISVTGSSASCTGNAATATTASNVSGSAGTDNVGRHVWFSNSGTEAARCYDDDFKYNPSTNALTVGSITGNAATATTASRVSGVAGTADVSRHVWFSDGGTETARNYDDDFKYNPSTNALTISKANIQYNSTTNSLDFVFT